VTSKDDGLSYVHRDGQNFDDHDEAHPSGSQGAIPLAPEQLRRAVEAAEECPGEIIFIELD
jgi:ferredoxin